MNMICVRKGVAKYFVNFRAKKKVLKKYIANIFSTFVIANINIKKKYLNKIKYCTYNYNVLDPTLFTNVCGYNHSPLCNPSLVCAESSILCFSNCEYFFSSTFLFLLVPVLFFSSESFSELLSLASFFL